MIYITAIKTSSTAAEHHITSVKWLDPGDGTAGTSVVEAIVNWIEAAPPGVAQVAGESGPSQIGVYERSGKKYLRSYADGDFTDNLLALPRL